MNLRIPSGARPDSTRRVLHLTPQRAGWKYVGFEVLRLAAGQSVARDTREREACLVWLSGMSTVFAGEQEWSRVGGRETPFDGPPAAVMPLLARSLAATLIDPLRSALVRYPQRRHQNSDWERRFRRCL